MTKLLNNAKTVLSNSRMFSTYTNWLSHKFIGLEPKIKIPYGGSVGHLRHFSEFWSVTNNIYKMTLEREYKLVQRLLSAGGCAFDIGANAGVFTIMMSMTCPMARIYAFEPVKSTFSILNSNILDNQLNNVICQNLAISDTCGSIKFIASENSPSQNKISPDENNHLETVSVEAINVDSFCEQQKIDFINFVKIDVEGAELLVLKSARQMLLNQKIGALLIEVIPQAIIDMGLELVELVNYLDSVGYDCHQVNEDGTEGKKLSLEEMKQFHLENILLVPSKSKKKMLKLN